MALTASKSSGPATRISTVVPSAKSAYTWLDPALACAVLTAASLAPGSEARADDAGVGAGVAEAIAHGDDTLDVPDLAPDGMAPRGGFRISLQGHDASLDRHRELARGRHDLSSHGVLHACLHSFSLLFLAASAAEDDLERAVVGGVGEHVVRRFHLIQAEVMGDEPLGVNLAAGDQAHQGRRGRGVLQARSDRYVPDPLFVQVQRDGSAVHADVRDP